MCHPCPQTPAHCTEQFYAVILRKMLGKYFLFHVTTNVILCMKNMSGYTNTSIILTNRHAFQTHAQYQSVYHKQVLCFNKTHSFNSVSQYLFNVYVIFCIFVTDEKNAQYNNRFSVKTCIKFRRVCFITSRLIDQTLARWFNKY